MHELIVVMAAPVPVVLPLEVLVLVLLVELGSCESVAEQEGAGVVIPKRNNLKNNIFCQRSSKNIA